MADLPSPEALSHSKLQPIEQRWPAAVVRGLRFQEGDYPLLDPALAELIQDNEQHRLSIQQEMYVSVARQLADGVAAVTVTIGGRPAWRFWADGRIDDL